MRKILRRRLPLHQIVVVTIVGVLAGTYIWRPVIQQYVADHPEVGRQQPGTNPSSAQESAQDTDASQ
ncbi:hypothetical protein BaRGS_00016098 [Batillaria attramentaria]|uniref:Uncharacterized protein n=1 Tax=Batillaria attramentaria TaxID=370345 RepID=A0ABD0KZL0_9CAEN